MPLLLQSHGLSISVGSSQLLENVNVQLSEGQRVALAGANGCGKSTLLRFLAAQTPSGRQASSDGLTVKYFNVSSGTINTWLSASGVLLVEQDMPQWSQLIHDAAQDEEELREMSLPEALDMAAAVGGEEAVEDAEAWRRMCVAANAAGLAWDSYNATPLGQLSPGCAVRAYLAIALHRRDLRLLLLDEPTNHLDLPSILWLGQAILASGKAAVIVSHDEAFLDAVADHVWFVNQHTLTSSGAKFSEFKHAQQLAREQQKLAYEQQQERHKKLSAAAEKLRTASAAGARYAGTDNDKMQRDFKRDRAGRSGSKAKAIESTRDAEPLVEKVVERAPLRIIMDPVSAGGDSSLVMSEVVLGYQETPPLKIEPITLRIDFGERVAIVGFNGVGKSTLLRTLTRAMPPAAGDVCVGRELRLGNLMQEHESLSRSTTPRVHVAELTGETAFNSGVRLIQYGLTRRQVDYPIGQLNPGARARLLLAIFSLRRVNTLILDEPTNHLDEEAIAEVSATLNDYKGTLIVVSHNLSFLRSLRLSRVLLLSSKGLNEVESVDTFVSTVEEAVDTVVQQCFSQNHR
eukprot:scaffold1243_cov403-Prasinococcus_capsulatus_cf.AAC.37